MRSRRGEHFEGLKHSIETGEAMMNMAQTCVTKLLNAADVAKVLRVSERTVWRMRDAGRLIEPVRLGRSCRWRAEELTEWMGAGCPGLQEWRILAPRWCGKLR